MIKKEEYLGYEKADGEKYIKLTSKKSSPFYQKNYADVFLFAMSVAISKKLDPTNLNKRILNIPISALGNRIWMINAISIMENKTHRALFNPKEVYDLAERYANAGIKILYSEVFDKPGDIFKKIESWIIG